MSRDDLDAPLRLAVVKWHHRIECVYLNDHRIAGGKPWGGGEIVKEFTVTIRDVVRAYPPLLEALDLDYLGNPK
jgi:hypothetical protein